MSCVCVCARVFVRVCERATNQIKEDPLKSSDVNTFGKKATGMTYSSELNECLPKVPFDTRLARKAVTTLFFTSRGVLSH